MLPLLAYMVMSPLSIPPAITIANVARGHNWDTPPKTKMTMEKRTIWRYISYIEHGDFPASHVSVRGVLLEIFFSLKSPSFLGFSDVKDTMQKTHNLLCFMALPPPKKGPFVLEICRFALQMGFETLLYQNFLNQTIGFDPKSLQVNTLVKDFNGLYVKQVWMWSFPIQRESRGRGWTPSENDEPTNWIYVMCDRVDQLPLFPFFIGNSVINPSPDRGF